MTNPNHTDTSRSGDLIYDLRNSKSIGPITQRAAADRIEALEAEVERLDYLLAGRDRFIVNKGLFDEFVKWLRDEPARAALALGEK